MNIIVLVYVLFICILSPGMALCREYSVEEMVGMGGRSVACDISTVKVYGFSCRSNSGELFTINTAKETAIYPDGERLYKGDHVNVVLFEPIDASDSINATVSYLVEIIKKEPRVFLSSPQVGVFSLYSDKGGEGLYIKEIDKLVRIEGMNSKANFRDLRIEIGKKYEVFFEVVPARIGNGYVYVADKVKKVSWEQYSGKK